MTIRDNVNAVHQLLTEELHIPHLRAVIGFSMGAQQAFQWSVSYPTYMDQGIVATSGTAKTYGHGIVRLEGQIAALTADPTFLNGDYTDRARNRPGKPSAWSGPAGSTRRSGGARSSGAPPPPPAPPSTSTCSASANASPPTPTTTSSSARTWESNDAGNTPAPDGKLHELRRRHRKGSRLHPASPFLYMPSATDLYFPLEDAQYEAPFIPHGTLMPIPSLWGHPAGAGADPADKQFLNEKIAAFLGN